MTVTVLNEEIFNHRYQILVSHHEISRCKKKKTQSNTISFVIFNKHMDVISAAGNVWIRQHHQLNQVLINFNGKIKSSLHNLRIFRISSHPLRRCCISSTLLRWLRLM